MNESKIYELIMNLHDDKKAYLNAWEITGDPFMLEVADSYAMDILSLERELIK
jgi:hypothetical protein